MMNPLDRYVYIYSCLANIKGVHRYVLTPFRRIVRMLGRRKINAYFLKIPVDVQRLKPATDVVVSLTSFPARIGCVHLVVNCMLRQTVTPKKVILWLSRPQFEGIYLPEELTRLQGDIFEIRFVEGDIRSHKKYHYVLQEYQDSQILIVDDDLFYPTDMLEQMLAAAERHPDTMICRYGSIAAYDENGILPYNEWWNEVSGTCDNPNFFFGSGGGTLLRKDMLHPDVLDIELAMKLTSIADDVWLNAMTNLAGTPKYKIRSGLIFQTHDQEVRLTSENVGNNANTRQINDICNHYKKQGLNPFTYRVQ